MWSMTPCRALNPIISEVANEYEGMDVEFYKINVDENPLSTAEFAISILPTVVFYKNGAMIDRVIGVASKETYIARIEQYM